jgi:hypothetical protein
MEQALAAPLSAAEIWDRYQDRQVELAALEDRITTLWGHLSAATCEFLLLLAEFDREKGWQYHGLANGVQWLNWRCGIGPVAAREKLRVARALEGLAKITAAFRSGEISYSKVRAMTRVATPENEDVLLNTALYGTAQHVERLVRYYRRVQRIEEARLAETVYQARSLDYGYEDECFVIRGRLPREVGALLQKAIEVAMEREWEERQAAEREEVSAESATQVNDASAETSRPSGGRLGDVAPEHAGADCPIGARRADALARILEGYLGTESDKAGATDRYQIVVHIDQQAVTDTDASAEAREGHDLCEIEDGPTLARETARRLGCDAALVGIVERRDRNGHCEILDVGRKTRAIPPAIRRALKARDHGCRFPGCDRKRYTEGHHVIHWADGGETKLANLVSLCHYHHHLVHESGFSVETVREDDFRFYRPDGSEIVANGALVHARFRGNISAIMRINRGNGIDIDKNTCRTRWRGESMDYDLAIDGLVHAANEQMR